MGFAVRLGRLDYDRIDHRRGISSSHFRLVRHAPANALIAVPSPSAAWELRRVASVALKPDQFRAAQYLGIRNLCNLCPSSSKFL